MNSADALNVMLRRDRVAVSVMLATVIGLAWVYLLAGAGTDMLPREMAMFLPERGLSTPGMATSQWTLAYAVLMLIMWWLMMIAMMLPSAAPMVLLHAAIMRRGLAEAGHTNAFARALVPTMMFVTGYLTIWGTFSLVAVLVQWVLERAGLLSAMMMSTSDVLGSGLLLAAGIWQLSPLKTSCLRRCRSPIGFLSAHWRSGIAGTFCMGVKHGAFCVGCCWCLMALLYFGGVMNLFWIVGLTLFVLVEKILPGGETFGKVSGLLLIVLGVSLAFSRLAGTS